MACHPCVKAFYGALGIAKAALGLGAAAREVIARRRAICHDCDKALPCREGASEKCWCGPLWQSLRGDARTCGCRLRYKTQLQNESCPLGKW